MADEIRFDRRALLVTGAGRGIGRAQALLLAARGAKVLLADNGSAMDGSSPSAGLAEAVASEIRAAGGEAAACAADLATPDGPAAAVSACVETFGRIDGLVHYASPCPELLPPEALPDALVEQVIAVNAIGGILLARAAWPHMAAARYGRMVFTPSAAIYGAPGNTPYATAKASYLGMVRCLALEGADFGICVNAVLPSAQTRMTGMLPSGPYLEWLAETMPPEKAAIAAAFLLSAECTTSGEAFAVGGGRMARVVLSEAAGTMGARTIEDIRDSFGAVMADTAFFHPRDLGERSALVSKLFGFDSCIANEPQH